MSDGITEARRGSYFSDKHKNVNTTDKVKHNKYYYDFDRNKPYKDYASTGTEFKSVYVGDARVESPTGYQNGIQINGHKIPDPKLHQGISFIKSGIRIVGYAFLPFNLMIATGVLILSEIIGIIEELV